MPSEVVVVEVRRPKKSQSNIYTILGLAAGAAIGAGVALVRAPGTGEETRKHLEEWIQARVQEAQSQVQARTQQVQRQVQTRVEDLQDKAQQAASQGNEWATNRVTDAKSKVQEAASNAASTAQGIINKDAGESPTPVETPGSTTETIVVVVPDDATTES